MEQRSAGYAGPDPHDSAVPSELEHQVLFE